MRNSIKAPGKNRTKTSGNVEKLIGLKAQFGMGLAVDLMKKGYKVTRAEWNGKFL